MHTHHAVTPYTHSRARTHAHTHTRTHVVSHAQFPIYFCTVTMVEVSKQSVIFFYVGLTTSTTTTTATTTTTTTTTSTVVAEILPTLQPIDKAEEKTGFTQTEVGLEK